jgi:beta-glucosidase
MLIGCDNPADKIFPLNPGTNLHGYFIWSPLDNFEWREGFSKRFALIYVNHTTQERFIKDSGRWVAELIRSQQI